MEDKTTKELILNIIYAWEEKWSVPFVLLMWVGLIIVYLLGIEPEEGSSLIKSISYFKIILCSIIPILLLIYIIYKRTHLPKIHGKSIGILFCISCFDGKQFENLRNKFITPFRAMINSSGCFEYDVIMLDKYLANKYTEKLQKASKSEKTTATLLRKTKCKILIYGSCIACAESEKNSCILNFPGGISCNLLKENDDSILKSHLKEIFSPLKNIGISKLNETTEFDNKAVELGFVFEYILALSNLICGNVDVAIKNLKDLKKSFDEYPVSPHIVMCIKGNYKKMLGVCYAEKANTEYEKFVETREVAYLEKAKEYMSHPEVDETHFTKNVFMTICVFKVERSVEKALCYARQCNMKDPLAKINKAFLKLYKECNVTNIRNAYYAYKDVCKISIEKVCELEAFIVEEYNFDCNKWQLLFLLTIIYLYQENVLLAKDCFDRFCEKAGTLLESKSIVGIISLIEDELSDIDMHIYSLKIN